MQNAFSLVELSIVLVILGLLTGGILAGQSLIRASELRAVGTEYHRYVTATHSFRDRYFQLPGDFQNATRVWNRMTGTGDCVRNNSTASVAAPGACDGNGSGLLDTNGGNGQASEIFQYWRQLALAGLIEGEYSGLAGPNSPSQAVLSDNVPSSRMAQLGWSIRSHIGATTGDSENFPSPAGNQFIYGKVFIGTGPVYGPTYGGGLTAQEAWNIDQKIDDGRPGLGKVVTYNRSTCTLSETDYNFTNTNARCGFYMIRPF